MKQPLTEQEKLNDKKRKALQVIHNSVLSAFMFKNLKTWGDIDKKMKIEGKDLSSTPAFPEVKAYLQNQKDELEKSFIQTIPTTEISTATLPSESAQVQSTASQMVGEAIKETEPTEDLSSKNDYGLHKSPDEKAFLYWFQKKACKELWDKILKEKKTGVLLLAPTGTGKTYMIGALARRLWDVNYHDGKTWSHIPYIYVTKSTVVEQASRVFKNDFNVNPTNDCEIINIEMLRSKAGQYWITEKKHTVVVNGEAEEIIEYNWKPRLNPCVCFFDESQGAKNDYSIQHKIMCAYNELKENSCLVSISATPFTRVSEAKCFAVSTHRPLEHLGFPKGTVLNNENWSTYAKLIAAPSEPDEFNQAAVERLMKDLEPWIVRVRGVRPQFDAVNSTRLIPFESPEKEAFYHQAWERFLAEKAKMEAEIKMGIPSGRHMILVQLLKYRMAAEECHADGFADEMHQIVEDGKAAVASVNFKNTIISIVKRLNEVYGVSRDKISIIWGGGQTQLTKKQKARKKIKELEKSGKLDALGVTAEEMLEDLDLDEVEDRELKNIPSHLRLGIQTSEERQREIDKFQRGESLYCIYTFRAGGVGLSLHHTDEYSKIKCRRKESGYVVEEDIPKIEVRPRQTIVSLTYNAIELVQGVGRVPRLTSLSPTIQHVYCYKGTVEEKVGKIVSRKLRCLTSVVKQHESWADIVMSDDRPDEQSKKISDIISSSDNQPDDESGIVGESPE